MDFNTTGSATAGTVAGVVATLPLESDGDTVEPVIGIVTARTATAASGAADGKGTAGAVAKLAEATDVAHDGTGDATAVVTADLLKQTNAIVEGLVLSPGGVTTVTTTDANGNSALSISPTAGNVVIELETADDSTYGVVQVASASDITNETAGPSAVVDASQLAAAIEPLPKTAVISVSEGGTDIVTGAVKVTTTADAGNANEKNVEVGIATETFCPYDFSSLTDITTI